MGYGKEEYGYSIVDSGNAPVSVGDGDYGMEVTAPSGKCFSRDGYDSFESALSGALQSIENMQARNQATLINELSVLDMLSPMSFMPTPFPGILCDDGRSA